VANPGCGHGGCTQGGPIAATCSLCAGAVCAADSYCCCTAWDDLCVARALATASCTECP
jgi:hypothetical protein